MNNKTRGVRKQGNQEAMRAEKNEICSSAILAVCIEGEENQVQSAIAELYEFINTIEEARGLKCEVLSQ